ncbi:MAG TPA: Asp-tRNA(Asn)/Glu-tRNA(Gln) amidotransferase subunit GatB [Gaiellaceae bacterium]|nr:Asp-tRNA(Asn)/Glu-tRNA(Gln) amidotransferase subunit GatB [Gaiellaceae bacterium]
MTANGWEPVIGLEIHVQLKTRTKMFCRCANVWGEPENTLTCPVCLAHPGTLPVPNKRAIEWTVKLGVALGCEIASRALFHRKNYFYPDLPKGYQISQYDIPLCAGGKFVLPGPDGDREIGIVRAHLEEDAAKTIHVGGTGGRIAGAEYSLVDFNRGGTPLVEIVSEPDIRSAEEARRFLQLLRRTVVELGISDAEMEKGSLRCDANVSVRRTGETGYRTKTELKNMNSFKFVADGIEAELRRQVETYEAGGEIEQETLHFDPASGSIAPLRSKEEAHDYRYFPEPDLLPVEPPVEMIASAIDEIGELPAARIRRLEAEVGFDLAEGLVASARDGLFERVPGDRRAVANVLMNQLAAAGVDPDAVGGAELGKLVAERDRIPRAAFVEALARSADPGFSADDYLGETAISDASELDPVIDSVLAENAAQVETFRSGKEGVLGYLVGQVMKATGGKADPRVVNERLRDRLRA